MLTGLIIGLFIYMFLRNSNFWRGFGYLVLGLMAIGFASEIAFALIKFDWGTLTVLALILVAFVIFTRRRSKRLN